MSGHSYIFFNSHPTIRTLSKQQFAKYKSEFIDSLEHVTDVHVASYATLGFKPDTHFMLHIIGEEADAIQQCVQLLMHTALGVHLEIRYTLLGLTRRSEYRASEHQEEKEFIDGKRKYLIVYPFTKTTEWHLLPLEERKEMMKEHVTVAYKFSESISQLLLYAYGIDDHEFILSYQTDNLLDFQTLVMELRNTKGRAYTQNDVPIFMCIYKPLKEVLNTL